VAIAERALPPSGKRSCPRRRRQKRRLPLGHQRPIPAPQPQASLVVRPAPHAPKRPRPSPVRSPRRPSFWFLDRRGSAAATGEAQLPAPPPPKRLPLGHQRRNHKPVSSSDPRLPRRTHPNYLRPSPVGIWCRAAAPDGESTHTKRGG
jgi:hypothetical protein